MATQRGKKSAASLSVVPSGTVALKQRPAVPSVFRDGSVEAKTWKSIVDAQHVDWFTSGDLPLLTAYCTAVGHHARVSEQCEGAAFTVTSAQGTLAENPLFKAQDRLVKQMATLSVKLRLSQSSRYDPQKANVMAKSAGQASATGTEGGGQKRRPWET